MQKAIDRTKINVKNQKKLKGKLIFVATTEDEGWGRESPSSRTNLSHPFD